MFYPVHDQFEGYNQLIFGAPSWLYTMLSSSILALYYSLKPIFTLINEPLFVISLLLYLCYVIYFGIKEYYSGKSLSKEWPALLFGLLLFFLAIFPYLAVGKKPVDHYNSRYFILIGIPIGIIIVSLMNLSVRLSLLSKNIKYFVFLVLIGAFVLADLNDYLTWQFRWIKDRSVMIQLAADPQAKEISTFYIRNKLFHPDESPIYDYRLSEWTGMFKSIWHDEKHLGLDESALNTIAIANLARLGHLSARFMLSDYNAKGAKALLVLSYPEQNESYLALKRFRRVIGRYYYYKYFDKKKLNGFLRKLVEVKVVKL
jgi:hypothetical protein